MHNAEATTELRASAGALGAHGARAPGGGGPGRAGSVTAAGAAARHALARATGAAARATASLGRGAGSPVCGASGWRRGLATADGPWSCRLPAGEVLLIVAPVLGPTLLSAGAVGRVALAMLVFAVMSDAARRLGQRVEGHRAGGLPARAGDGSRPVRGAAAWWRAWTLRLAPLALALAAALTLLEPGFAVVALAFLAVQVCRALGTGRSAASAAALLALAVVLRVDAGAVALGAALRPHLLVFACLFGLFLGLCQGRERLLSAPRGRWPIELARRYVDVGIAALLCGLIVGCVHVLGHDPAIRAAAGAWAYLGAPFVLGGLLRYWHLAVVEERPVARPGLWLTDPVLAVAVAGCVATFALSLHL